MSLTWMIRLLQPTGASVSAHADWANNCRAASGRVASVPLCFTVWRGWQGFGSRARIKHSFFHAASRTYEDLCESRRIPAHQLGRMEPGFSVGTRLDSHVIAYSACPCSHQCRREAAACAIWGNLGISTTPTARTHGA